MPASAAFQAAIDLGIVAVDELIAYGNSVEPTAGVPLVSTRLAAVGTLQSQLDTAVAERDARQVALVGAAARAQARKDADVAKAEGQDDLDAFAPFVS